MISLVVAVMVVGAVAIFVAPAYAALPATQLVPVTGAIDPSVLAVAVSTILGGGIIFAIAAYRKAGPEADAIAAKTLILVNEELRKELGRRDQEIARLTRRVSDLEQRLAGIANARS